MAALCNWLVKRHLRGPLIPVSVVLFAAVALAQPTLGEPDSALRHRGTLSLILGAGGLILTLLALVLPHASLRLRLRSVPGGGPGPSFRQLGVLAGHGLGLVVMACLLAMTTHFLLLLRIGNPDARGSRPLVREILTTEPGERFALRDPEHPMVLKLPFHSVPREAPEVRLRLAPALVLESRSQAPSGGMDARVQVSWRMDGAGPMQRRTVRVNRGRPQVVTITIDRNRAGGDGANWLSGVLEVHLARQSGGAVPVFTPGSITLLGNRASALTTIMRSYLLLAVSALGVLALCQWFSGFVSYPLAVAASMTVVLLSGTALPWLPGAPSPDPGSRVSWGAAVAWADLLPSVARLVGCVLLLSFFPLVDRRMGEDLP